MAEVKSRGLSISVLQRFNADAMKMLEPDRMKICKRCNAEKETSCFHVQSARKDGLCPYCKECRTIERQLIRLENGMGINTDNRNVEQKFIDFVYPEPNTGCWIWGGNINRSGYAVFYDTGFISGHRYSYKYFKGDFDSNLSVLHKCDVRCCVNPDHLFLGTHRDNMLDMDSKGRRVVLRGSHNGNSKLSESDVLQIRKLHNPKVYPTRKLAKMYSVNQRLIWNIINRKSWRHL